CQPCILGKQAMTLIPKMRVGLKSARRLGKVFIDITGPFMQSSQRTMYNMAIIDDFSAFLWNRQLKGK
ncbi:hypothetical protein BDV98DRAFT_477064, partial [Pterulicium gracile]